MTIDFNKVKVGDHVTVRMKVIKSDYNAADDGQALYCEPMGQNFKPQWLYNDDIVTHEPRALAVGDIVRYKGETNRYKIVCIDDDIAWIKAVAGIGRTHTKLSHIERAE